MFTIRMKDVSGYSTETHFKEIKWLASALATDDERFHVSHIWIREDRQGIATDGMRMHIVHMTSLAPGYYKVVKNARWAITLQRVDDADTFDFPDVDVAMDQDMLRPVLMDCSKDADIEYTHLIRKMSDNSVRYQLFVAAVDGMETYEIKFDEDSAHAIFINAPDYNRSAIVMPFRF
jgi:hypothetical protein